MKSADTKYSCENLVNFNFFMSVASKINGSPSSSLPSVDAFGYAM